MPCFHDSLSFGIVISTCLLTMKLTHSSWSTIPSNISSGGARFDVQRKWTLYSRWTSACGNPAGVKRKELCLFHFFDKFPDVSSQYNQRGIAYTRAPDARTRHRLPSKGLVKVHGCNSPFGSRSTPKHIFAECNKQSDQMTLP